GTLRDFTGQLLARLDGPREELGRLGGKVAERGTGSAVPSCSRRRRLAFPRGRQTPRFLARRASACLVRPAVRGGAPLTLRPRAVGGRHGNGAGAGVRGRGRASRHGLLT